MRPPAKQNGNEMQQHQQVVGRTSSEISTASSVKAATTRRLQTCGSLWRPPCLLWKSAVEHPNITHSHSPQHFTIPATWQHRDVGPSRVEAPATVPLRRPPATERSAAPRDVTRRRSPRTLLMGHCAIIKTPQIRPVFLYSADVPASTFSGYSYSNFVVNFYDVSLYYPERNVLLQLRYSGTSFLRAS